MKTAGRSDGLTAGLRLLVLAMLLAFPRLAIGQDADTREIAAYRLTDAALAKYLRAARGLAALTKPAAAADTSEDAEEQDRDDDDEEGDDAKSIDEVAAMYDANPAARRAITGAGLTTREYVVFTFALFQAGLGAWTVEQQGWSKLPPEFTRANVEFYQRHKATLDSLTTELKGRDEDPT